MQVTNRCFFQARRMTKRHVLWSDEVQNVPPLGRRNIKVTLSSKQTLSCQACGQGVHRFGEIYKLYSWKKQGPAYPKGVFYPVRRYVKQLKVPKNSQLKSTIHCYHTLYTFARNTSISNPNYISQQYFLYWHKTHDHLLGVITASVYRLGNMTTKIQNLE